MPEKAQHLSVGPGIDFWPGYFSSAEQRTLLDEIMSRVAHAPFYTPTMPKSGTPFSVAMTNFGTLGWMSDKGGYRYQAQHPVTGEPWPDIPPVLLDAWNILTGYGAPPEACLVNLYAAGAKMGLHRDADEPVRDAPVLSVSLGDTAQFRIGGPARKDPTKNFPLASGDVLSFGGPARMAYHGVTRVLSGTSQLIEDGGRINLTLRRVTRP